MAKRWDTMTRNKHCVYRLDYHMVFVVKYRRPCITDEMGRDMVKAAAGIAERKGGKLIEGKADRDHLHLLVSLPPALNLSDVVGSMKMSTSKVARNHYREEVEKYLWGDRFWSDSYYIATAGGAGLDTIQRYIENQGTEPRTKNVRRQG